MQPNKNQKPQQIRSPQISQAPTQAVITPSIKRWRLFKSSSDLIILVVVTVVACWLILTYVVGFTVVNGISMQPTLYTGNVLVVWKLPQTWAKITRSQYMPKRSNVVIVEDTNNSGELFVKRVIGLPGDHINITSGVVTIYSNKYPSGFNPDSAPYGKNLIPTEGIFSGQVGVSQIFVMGDNRAAGASIDSRSSLGNIPSGNIVGQVILRIYPFNKIKTF